MESDSIIQSKTEVKKELKKKLDDRPGPEVLEEKGILKDQV